VTDVQHQLEQIAEAATRLPVEVVEEITDQLNDALRGVVELTN